MSLTRQLLAAGNGAAMRIQAEPPPYVETRENGETGKRGGERTRERRQKGRAKGKCKGREGVGDRVRTIPPSSFIPELISFGTSSRARDANQDPLRETGWERHEHTMARTKGDANANEAQEKT